MLSVHLIKKLFYCCVAPGVQHDWSDSARGSVRDNFSILLQAHQVMRVCYGCTFLHTLLHRIRELERTRLEGTSGIIWSNILGKSMVQTRWPGTVFSWMLVVPNDGESAPGKMIPWGIITMIIIVKKFPFVFNNLVYPHVLNPPKQNLSPGSNPDLSNNFNSLLPGLRGTSECTCSVLSFYPARNIWRGNFIW